MVRNGIIGLQHTLNLHIGIQHVSETGFLAKEIYFLSKIQENLTCL